MGSINIIKPLVTSAVDKPRHYKSNSLFGECQESKPGLLGKHYLYASTTQFWTNAAACCERDPGSIPAHFKRVSSIIPSGLEVRNNQVDPDTMKWFLRNVQKYNEKKILAVPSMGKRHERGLVTINVAQMQ